MKRIRTIFTASIIMAAALPLFLSAFFIAGRLIIRHIMLERMERENLQTVVIAESAFKWYREGREIIVDGRMFDVMSIEKEADHFLISGVFDELETALNKQLERTTDKDNPADGSNTIYQVCLGLVAEKPFQSLCCTVPEVQSISYTNNRNISSLCRVFLDRVSPPPEA